MITAPGAGNALMSVLKYVSRALRRSRRINGTFLDRSATGEINVTRISTVDGDGVQHCRLFARTLALSRAGAERHQEMSAEKTDVQRRQAIQRQAREARLQMARAEPRIDHRQQARAQKKRVDGVGQSPGERPRPCVRRNSGIAGEWNAIRG